jgi:hypothetical protein
MVSRLVFASLLSAFQVRLGSPNPVVFAARINSGGFGVCDVRATETKERSTWRRGTLQSEIPSLGWDGWDQLDDVFHRAATGALRMRAHGLGRLPLGNWIVQG